MRNLTRVKVSGRLPRIRKSPAIRAAEIIRVSCGLLIKEGAAAFNLRRVADTVGICLSTLQHHFPTRECLLTQTLERILEELRAPFESLATRCDLRPDHRLRMLCELSIQSFSEKDRAHLVLDIFALGYREPFAQNILDRQYRSYQSIFERVLREIGVNCPDDTIVEAAALIASQLQGLLMFVLRGTSCPNALHLVNQQVNQLVAVSLGRVNGAP